MRLGTKQEIFALNYAKLILWANNHGYMTRLGQVERTEAEARRNAKAGIGTLNSLHILKLAGDINLFKWVRKDGKLRKKFLRKTSDHAPLGKYWKRLHPLNRWGGDFTRKKDGNHYSMAHAGRA